MKSRIKNWLNKFHRKTRSWMTGRYGPDRLSLHICALSCAVMLVGVFTLSPVLAAVATALMLLAVARICSKNLKRRFAELDSYEKLLIRLSDWAFLQKIRWRDRKTYRYYRCKCGKILRVPKGKGRIGISCPECHSTYIKKT